MSYVEVFGASAAALVVLMFVTWLVSLRLRDASIVDIVWGLAFVVTAWTAFAVSDGDPARKTLLVVLTTVWGVRLAVHLLIRNSGKGEDPRYQAMRRHHGERFGRVSLYTVFGLQAAVAWVVSLPVQMGQVPKSPEGLGAIEWAGAGLWLVGLGFETVGDTQLARFQARPDSADRVMDQGLWRYTRHPNYFGDFCVWWGLFLIAAATGVGVASVVGPIVMTIFLLRVSGVALLERSIARRRPGYDDYVRRTSTFFPRPPLTPSRSGPQPERKG